MLARVALALFALGASVAAWAQDLTPQQREAYKRPASIPFPADNPYTPAKAALGKMLFFETRLSRDKNISCATCHSPSFGWEVPFAQAIGAGGKPLGRSAPSAINHAWSSPLFWDGRAATLEQQAMGPLISPAEMDMPMATAVERLKAVEGYQRAFAKAFPEDGLTQQNILKAIATFERTIVTGDTPFDRWVRGDAKAVTPEAQRGFALFVGKAGCAGCHTGWNFTDGKFHDIGLATDDKGRAGVTNSAADNYAFKTPSLREIEARAPYMHKGQIATLEGVVVHYATGGESRPSRSALMKPVALNQAEVGDLASFMRALSSPQTIQSMPNLPAR